MHISTEAFIGLLILLAVATFASPFVELRGTVRAVKAHRILYTALTVFILATCFW